MLPQATRPAGEDCSCKLLLGEVCAIWHETTDAFSSCLIAEAAQGGLKLSLRHLAAFVLIQVLEDGLQARFGRIGIH